MRILKKKKKKYLSEKVLRFEDVFKRIYALLLWPGQYSSDSGMQGCQRKHIIEENVQSCQRSSKHIIK